MSYEIAPIDFLH